jgi:hypothetical protein
LPVLVLSLALVLDLSQAPKLALMESQEPMLVHMESQEPMLVQTVSQEPTQVQLEASVLAPMVSLEQTESLAQKLEALHHLPHVLLMDRSAVVFLLATCQ